MRWRALSSSHGYAEAREIGKMSWTVIEKNNYLDCLASEKRIVDDQMTKADLAKQT
jgi:hypothetical protein